MLMIRLSRVGKHNSPAFRMVVQEKSRAPKSRSVEIVGSYIPYRSPKIIQLKTERITYWLGKGAQPTDTVHNLLVSQGVIKAKKVSITSITKKRVAKIEAKKVAKAKVTEKKEETPVT